MKIISCQCDDCRELGKLLIRLFKTASASLGIIAFKNGKSLLVLQDISNRLQLSDALRASLMVVSSTGILYVLAFTRLPSFWKKFNSDQQNTHPEEGKEIQTKCQKSFIGIAYIVGITRAPFILLNTYVGFQATLQAVGVKTDTPVSFSSGIYIALANLAAYRIYTFGSIYNNCIRLATAEHACGVDSKIKFLLKRFLDLGTISFSALSYFLTEKTLTSVPLFYDHLSSENIRLISGFSAVTALFSEIFSKNMELQNLVDNDGMKFFQKIKTEKSKWIYPHMIAALIFIAAMSVAYYFGCLGLCQDIGVSDTFKDSSWYAIMTYSLFAISGGALELAFGVKPMFDFMPFSSKEGIPINNGGIPAEEAAPSIQVDYRSMEQGNLIPAMATVDPVLNVDGYQRFGLLGQVPKTNNAVSNHQKSLVPQL